MNRVDLKIKAKESLKGKYLDAIVLLIVLWLINYVIGLLLGLGCDVFKVNEKTSVLLSNIVTFISSSLFSFGTISYYLKLSRNEEVNYKELFSKFNLFIPYMAISILTGIFTLLWSLLFIIPGIIALISYSLVYYIKLDNPELGTLEVIGKSKEMMKGHKMDYFVLNLSFLGWVILGALTLGILDLWLKPYMNVTLANFYNSLKETTV